MKKYLITGFSGFVSQYFIKYLLRKDDKFQILGLDVNEPVFVVNELLEIPCNFHKIDLLCSDQIENLVYSFQPDYILHLASYSSVGFSWKNPSLSFRNNINIFLNLMEIVREACPRCRVLSVGSSEEYGNCNEEMLPLKEDYPLSPVSPYAVARVSQEQLSKVYCNGYELDVVMTRSFNHIGPGQKEIFVISSFARQLVEIKKGLRNDRMLITGDVDIIRDFLDVRDVVDAYYKLLIEGEKSEVYNVCSGRGVSLHDIIRMMSQILDVDVEIRKDDNLIRPNDNRMVYGDNSKLKKATGWRQEISLEKSLKDIIDYWIKNL